MLSRLSLWHFPSIITYMPYPYFLVSINFGAEMGIINAWHFCTHKSIWMYILSEDIVVHLFNIFSFTFPFSSVYIWSYIELAHFPSFTYHSQYYPVQSRLAISKASATEVLVSHYHPYLSLVTVL